MTSEYEQKLKELLEREDRSEQIDERYLDHAVEEMGEMLKAIGKMKRFGLNHYWYNEGMRNYEALAVEFGQLLEVMKRLNLPTDLIAQGVKSKKERLKTYGPDTWKPAVTEQLINGERKP